MQVMFKSQLVQPIQKLLHRLSRLQDSHLLVLSLPARPTIQSIQSALDKSQRQLQHQDSSQP